MGIKKTRIENKVRGEKKWKRNKGEGEFREKRNRTAKEGEGERLKAYSPQVPLGGSMTCPCSCSNVQTF